MTGEPEYTDNTDEFVNTSLINEDSLEFIRAGNSSQKLTIPPWIRDKFPDKFLRWFRFDQPSMNRAARLQYEFVPADEYPEIVKAIGDFDLGENNERTSDKVVRTGDLGNQLVLMMIDSRVKAKYDQVKKQRNDAKLRGGLNPDLPGFEGSKTTINTKHLE